MQFLYRLMEKPREEEKTILIKVDPQYQYPELPTGCEVTSLSMLLYWAFQLNNRSDLDFVSRFYLASAIAREPEPQKSDLPAQCDQKRFPPGFKSERALFIGGNPHRAFVGEPHLSSSFGVFHEPVAQLLESILPGESLNLTPLIQQELKRLRGLRKQHNKHNEDKEDNADGSDDSNSKNRSSKLGDGLGCKTSFICCIGRCSPETHEEIEEDITELQHYTTKRAEREGSAAKNKPLSELIVGWEAENGGREGSASPASGPIMPEVAVETQQQPVLLTLGKNVLCRCLDEGKPLVIWVTLELRPVRPHSPHQQDQAQPNVWVDCSASPSGRGTTFPDNEEKERGAQAAPQIVWHSPEHCVLLVGYVLKRAERQGHPTSHQETQTKENERNEFKRKKEKEKEYEKENEKEQEKIELAFFLVNDPHTGKLERYDAILLLQRWAAMGAQAVTLRHTPPFSPQKLD